jgi:hypothetical protein
MAKKKVIFFKGVQIIIKIIASHTYDMMAVNPCLAK